MRQLSKKEQENLMWEWATDPALELIYKDFSNYVRAKVGITIKKEDV